MVFGIVRINDSLASTLITLELTAAIALFSTLPFRDKGFVVLYPVQPDSSPHNAQYQPYSVIEQCSKNLMSLDYLEIDCTFLECCLKHSYYLYLVGCTSNNDFVSHVLRRRYWLIGGT